MKYLILYITIFCFQITVAQSQQNDLVLTVGGVMAPNFGNNRLGLDVSTRYYFTDSFSAGGHFYSASPRFKHGFGFETDRTLINMYAINIPLQYDVFSSERFTVGLGLSNGLLFNVLRNRNDIKEVEYFDVDTGIRTLVQVPRRLKTDTYYTLTPYIEGNLKLLSLDKNDGTSLFLTGKFGYQNAFGNGSFSKSNDFSNFIVSIGFTIKGTLD